MLNFMKALRRDERGVSALEYAILAAVILGVVITAITLLGTDITELFGKIGTKMDGLGL